MYLTFQKERWQCVITSFSMVLRYPVEHLIKMVGHDGSEVPLPWKHLEEPIKRRGHSIQEMIDVCFQLHHSVTPIILVERFITKEGETGITFATKHEQEHRIANYLTLFDGVLTGTVKSGKRHCVAWDHQEQMIYDPSGGIYPIGNGSYFIETFWLVQKSNHSVRK